MKPETAKITSGLWIALYGPDGAGKSAVAAHIATELTPLFSGVQLHHLRIPLWRSKRQIVAVTAPHAQKPRGLVLSFVKLFYMFAHSWMAHVMRVLVWVAGGQLVVSDRYFVDYAIDPQRYRLAAASVRLASLLGRLAPQPDLQFVLDVPAGELQRRKHEVTLSESQRQRHEYAARIGRLPNTILVDGNRSVSEVALHIVSEVLQRMNHPSAARANAPASTLQDAAR